MAVLNILIAIFICFNTTAASAAKLRVLRRASTPLVNRVMRDLAPIWNRSGNCLKTTLAKITDHDASPGTNAEQLRMNGVGENVRQLVDARLAASLTLERETDGARLEGRVNNGQFRHVGSEEYGQVMFLAGNLRQAVLDGHAVYAGRVPGGEIYALYDARHDEVATFTYSNFGVPNGCGD